MIPFRQLHLDCHTPALDFDFAKDFDIEEFKRILTQSHINSVTLTARCHHGFIYYDTDLEAKHPNLTYDFLLKVVDACHEIGVRCPLYLTVGWDAYMAYKHPEWLEIHEDGSYYGFEDYGQLQPGWKTLCFNSEYITYLKMVIDDVMNHFQGKLDGLFFDILWQDDCYCNNCLTKMKKIGYNPKNKKDVHLFAKYTEEKTKKEIYEYIRKKDKKCSVFFNEGNITPEIRKNLDQYSHIEIESLPGAKWGYQHFPVTVRYAKTLGKEYVGMTARFHKGWGDFGSYKNYYALRYEMLLALSHGAKCSIGDQFYPDGHFNKTAYDLISRVYKEIEQKEPYSYDVQSVATIAIVHTGVIDDNEVSYSLAGANNMLNELHYQFDIIDLSIDINKYELIILPDCIELNIAEENKLKKYIQNGGKVLSTYQSLLKENQFPGWTLLTYLGESDYSPVYLINKVILKDEILFSGKSINVYSKCKQEKMGLPLYQRDYNHYYGHYHAPFETLSESPSIVYNDNFTYIAHNIFEQYKKDGNPIYRKYIEYVLKKLAINKYIEIKHFPIEGDMVVNYQSKEKRFIINLLYYVPVRKSEMVDVIDDEIELNKIEISIDKQLLFKYGLSNFKSITLFNHEAIEYQEDNQKIYFVINSLKGHQMIIVNCK